MVRGDQEEKGDAAERLSDAFRERWKRAYGVSSSLILKPLEYMQLDQQIAAHGEAQLLAALDAYFATDDPYVQKAKHPLGLFLRDPLKHLAKAPATAAKPQRTSPVPDADATREHQRRLREQAS